MFVISPADEVVYLSYGRLIYVPEGAPRPAPRLVHLLLDNEYNPVGRNERLAEILNNNPAESSSKNSQKQLQVDSSGSGESGGAQGKNKNYKLTKVQERHFKEINSWEKGSERTNQGALLANTFPNLKEIVSVELPEEEEEKEEEASTSTSSRRSSSKKGSSNSNSKLSATSNSRLDVLRPSPSRSNVSTSRLEVPNSQNTPSLSYEEIQSQFFDNPAKSSTSKSYDFLNTVQSETKNPENKSILKTGYTLAKPEDLVNGFDYEKRKPRPSSERNKRLSYSDFLPLNRSKSIHNPGFAAGDNNKGAVKEKSSSGKSAKNDKQTNFDELFALEGSAQLNNGDEFSSERSLGKKKLFGKAGKGGIESSMAGNESALRELTHPGFNEALKSHNSVTFKLVRTVSDFTQQLGQIYEHHAEELQLLISNFRKRNSELRKERPACPSSLYHTWETLLQEVEIDSQAFGDIASILGRQVSRPLLEKSFYRKIQSRKVFTHRESYETIIAKTEEKLLKCRQEYKNAYLVYLTQPSTDSLSEYFNTHNAYVQQLHATNGMLEEYGKETLPQLLQELEEIYSDLAGTICDHVLQGAEVVSTRAMEQYRRYDGLVAQCKSVSGPNDLAHMARTLPAPPGRGLVMKRPFNPPQPPPPPETDDPNAPDVLAYQENIPPPLKDELVIDRLSAVQVKPSHDALRKEAQDLEIQIKQIQEALDTLLRIQQRSLEASLFNKANEIQEDISMKKFDLRVAQIHLRAINSQKELFSNKLDTGDAGRDRKNSSVSTGSMKTKWLKAFKSLKTPPPESEKKNGSATNKELLKGDPDAHNFQEYTYKKITPCDVCSQVLRGHTRQGLKCRICKMNVHLDCMDKASKCTAKARLLRRQKSTSEIETKVPETTVEEEKHKDGVATSRPFGQPLWLGVENGNGMSLSPPPTPPSPSPSKTTRVPSSSSLNRKSTTKSTKSKK